jgi:hypothetical protein
MPLIRPAQTYVLSDLPRGKYIVCGEAMTAEGEGYQESCFETRILRAKSESKYMFSYRPGY